MRRVARVLLAGAVTLMLTAAASSAAVVLINSSQWWRNCATLDMDFANNRYFFKNGTACNGTGGTTYNSLSSFISAVGATFTRAGTTTATASGDPIYLDTPAQTWSSRAAAAANNITTPSGSFYADNGQSFVSRAAVSNNVTWTLPSSFLDTGQTWVSHATDPTGFTPGVPFYSKATGAIFTSRNSVGTYFTSTGSFQTAAANTIRNSYVWDGTSWANNGSLFEPAATNLIRNNGTGGAAGGTGGAGGALPTNWSIGLPAGLSYSVSAIGTEDGVPSFTVTVSGTNTSGAIGYAAIFFDNASPVTAGTVYTLSGYARVTSGTLPAPAAFYTYWANSGGTFLSNSLMAAVKTTATTLPRSYTWGSALAPAGAATATTGIAFNVAAGATVNFTLYVGSPQFEQGSYATSTIVTSGSTATRGADIYGQQLSNSFNSSGTLGYTGAGSARTNAYYYNGASWVLGGTQVEPASTNYIRNSRLGGAFAGSPGIMPTYFALDGLPPGVSYSVVGTGTTQGMNYVDVSVSGTNNAGAQACPIIWFETPDGISGAVGQSWTHSVYLATTSGSVGLGRQWYNYNSSFAVLGGGAGTGIVPTTTLTRYSFTDVVGDAATSYVRPMVFWCMGAGTTVNFTLRIASPQFEQRSTATAPIPTGGAAMSRNADIVNWQPASYFDSAGIMHYAPADAARTSYVYNGSAWSAGGTLLEPAKTNIALASHQAASSGVAAGSARVDATNAPDNSFTGVKIIEDTTNTRHYSNKYATLAAGQLYTYSIFMKAGERTFAYLYGGKSGSPYTRGGLIVNLSNGTFSNFDVGPPPLVANRTVTNVGNGWYRVSMTVLIDNTSTDGYMEYGPCVSASSCGYAGNGTSGAYFWGTQIEQGTLTSYIPTSGVAVTRTADIANWDPATYFDNAGQLRYSTPGSARTDYAFNGTSWTSQGVLAEPARTNLSAYSISTSGVSNCAGCDSKYVVSNAIAPDGRTNWLKCVDGTLTAKASACRWGIPAPTTATYTVSLFAKAAERSVFTLLASSASGTASATVSLADGTSTICNSSMQATTAIQDIGNGVYRVSLTFTISDVSGGPYYDVRLSNVTSPSCTGATYNGDGVSGIYFWGIQLEQAGTASSFIPTNGAAVTRPADVYTTPSGGTYFDSTGTLRSVAANTPRLDYDPVTREAEGILIEEARTNLVRNSAAVGAAAGTLPTYWNAGPSLGVTPTVVATGTESGIPYIDVQFTGTASASGSIGIGFEGINSIAASPSAILTTTAYIKLVSGAFHTGATPILVMANYNNGGSALGQYATNPAVATSASLASQRYRVSSSAATFNGGATAYVRPYFQMNLTNGVAVNVTLRFGLPQLEAGAFPTSPIPTYGSAVTRSSDNFKIPGSAGWIGAGTHTMGASAVIPYSTGGAYPAYAFLDDGVSGGAYIVLVYTGSGLYNYGEVKGGGVQTFLGGQGYTLGNRTSVVLTAGDGTARFASDGASPSAVSKTTPSVSFFGIGGLSYGTGSLNGWLSRLWYMPTREPDTSLGDYSR